MPVTGLAWGAVFALGASLFSGCASREKIYVPEDMPDICRDLDFRNEVQLRNACGVQAHYLAYRNIPEHRELLQPKAGLIVKKGKSLQLRLENFLPIDLPRSFRGRIRFGEDVRRNLIKSKMDYCEFFPAQADRPEKLIRLMIPFDTGDSATVCYTVEPKIETLQRDPGYASQLSPLDCGDFARKQAASEKAEAPPGD